MAKRRKTIIAGRLVSEIAYRVAYPRDPAHVRQAKSRMSSKARQRLNLKAACKRLELVLAANFSSRDIMVTLTYRDADLPAGRGEAVKRLKRFFVQLRAHRKARGQQLRYVYVTEDRHSAGRLHHHVVLNGTGADLEILQSLWRWGDNLDLAPIDLHGYQGLAEYLAKEPKQAGAAAGRRMWTPSRGLRKPETHTDWIDDSTTLEPPPNAIVLARASERNEFGEYVYLKYLLPDYPLRRCRPRRTKLKKGALFSDLEPCISYESRV